MAIFEINREQEIAAKAKVDAHQFAGVELYTFKACIIHLRQGKVAPVKNTINKVRTL